VDRDLSEDRDKALLASRASRISSDRLEAGAASVTFLRNSRKCLGKPAVAARREAKSKPRVRMSCSISKWSSWRLSRAQAKLFRTVARTFAEPAREIGRSLELHRLPAVAAGARVSKTFARALL